MDAPARFFNLAGEMNRAYWVWPRRAESPGGSKLAAGIRSFGGYARPIPIESKQISSFYMTSEKVLPTEARRAAGSVAHDTFDRPFACSSAK
ncbi:hypothetical protein [Caballeronia pedi]|uniref:hypothetical protein n=1 Tax=Caballeronia pedi TaxID=1777141 RepID=UPI000A7CC18D|nr:hypothetical protein [Caballeronia pedi]